MGLRGGLFGIFFVHFLLMQRDGEQKIFFVNQQKRNLHEHKYMYFMTLVAKRANVQDFMAHRPEYTKANKFKDIIFKIYL